MLLITFRENLIQSASFTMNFLFNTMSKNIKSYLILLLLIQCLTGACQSPDSTVNFPLKGKWDVLSKVEVEKSDGKVIDQDEEVYKSNESFSSLLKITQ